MSSGKPWQKCRRPGSKLLSRHGAHARELEHQLREAAALGDGLRGELEEMRAGLHDAREEQAEQAKQCSHARELERHLREALVSREGLHRELQVAEAGLTAARREISEQASCGKHAAERLEAQLCEADAARESLRTQLREAEARLDAARQEADKQARESDTLAPLKVGCKSLKPQMEDVDGPGFLRTCRPSDLKPIRTPSALQRCGSALLLHRALERVPLPVPPPSLQSGLQRDTLQYGPLSEHFPRRALAGTASAPSLRDALEMHKRPCSPVSLAAVGKKTLEKLTLEGPGSAASGCTGPPKPAASKPAKKLAQAQASVAVQAVQADNSLLRQGNAELRHLVKRARQLSSQDLDGLRAERKALRKLAKHLVPGFVPVPAAGDKRRGAA